MKSGIVAGSQHRGAKITALVNPNTYGTALGDNFGSYVGTAINQLIVGSPTEDNSSALSSGAAYIFSTNSGILQHTLTNPNTTSSSQGDRFGKCVAISDSYAAVGAPGHDIASPVGINAGKVSVYNTSNGTLIGTIIDPNSTGTATSDEFGISLAMNDSYLVVGAPGSSDNGTVYVFNLPSLSLRFTSSSSNTTDKYGQFVGISSTFYRGYADTGTTTNFVLSSGAYSSSVSSPNVALTSVAFSNTGGYVAVSDKNYDDGAVNTGIVRVYTESGSLLSTIYTPTPFVDKDNDQFGKSIAVSGNLIAIGAAQGFINGGQLEYVHLYNILTPNSPIASFKNPNPFGDGANDGFGDSIAIIYTPTSSKLIIGAKFEDTALSTDDIGKTYIYDITSLV